MIINLKITPNFSMAVVHPSQVINNPHNQNECSICISDFTEEDLVVQGICKHIFHQECQENWKNSPVGDSSLCSICRQAWVELDQSQIELYTKIQKAFDDAMGKIETENNGWLKDFMGGIQKTIKVTGQFEDEEIPFLAFKAREKLASALAHRKEDGKDVNLKVAVDVLIVVLANFLHQKKLEQIKDKYPQSYKLLEEEHADLVTPSTVEEVATISQITHFRALVIKELLTELESGKDIDKEFIKSSLENANTTLQKMFGIMFLRYEISDVLKAPENIVKEFDESIAFAETSNLDKDKLWSVCKELTGKVKEKVAKQKFDEALDEIKMFDYSLNGFSFGRNVAKVISYFAMPLICAANLCYGQQPSIDSMSKVWLGFQMMSNKDFLDKKTVKLTDVFMRTLDSNFNRREFSLGSVVTGALSVVGTHELVGYFSSTSYKQLYNL